MIEIPMTERRKRERTKVDQRRMWTEHSDTEIYGDVCVAKTGKMKAAKRCELWKSC